MIKEIDLAGVFISPMLGYLAVALVLLAAREDTISTAY